MPDLSALYKPGPYHLLAYGTLLGTGVFQTFVGGVTAYRALPRASFSQLQQAIFPIYFSMQTVLPVILAFTFPVPHQTPASSLSPISSVLFGPQHRTSTLLPIGVSFVCGLANWAYFGPATKGVMRERKHQETRDGKKYYDPGPHSPAMQNLNKRFGFLHGMSSLLNLIALLSTVGYGLVLGSEL